MMMMKQQTQEATRFRTYTLRPVLPETDRLVFDPDTSILVQLREGDIIEIQHFSDVETSLVLALLEQYPDYLPYEEVLSALTGASVERCRARLYASLDEIGGTERVMHPVRNCLVRLYPKLHPFGLQLKAIFRTGYMLLPLTEKQRARLRTGGNVSGGMY